MADNEEEKVPQDEDNPLKEEVITQLPPDQEYLAMSNSAAPREVELPKDEGKPKTLTDAMDDATDLTDMQFAASRLFPKNFGFNDVMVSRIAPEAFLSLLQMMVTNDVMMANPHMPFDTNKSIVTNYGLLTVGLEGRGRIDFAELLGAAREIKKEESLLKGL